MPSIGTAIGDAYEAITNLGGNIHRQHTWLGRLSGMLITTLGIVNVALLTAAFCSQTELNATEAALIKKIETQRSRLRQKYYATEVIRHHIRLWRLHRGEGGMRVGMRNAISASALKAKVTGQARSAKADFLYSLRAFKSAAAEYHTQVSNVQVHEYRNDRSRRAISTLCHASARTSIRYSALRTI